MKKIALLIILLFAPFIVQSNHVFAQSKEMTPEEFVANNLKKTRERLEELKKRQGIQIKELSIRPKAIIEALPKPHTLQFVYETKREKAKEEQEEDIKIISGAEQIFPGDIRITAYSRAAADDLTSSILHIPRNIEFSLRQGGVISKRVKSERCCINWIFDNNEGPVVCTEYADDRVLSLYRINPVGILNNFSLQASSGGNFIGQEAIRFSRPGKGVITVTLSQHYDYDKIKPDKKKVCIRAVRSSQPKPGTKDVYTWIEEDNETEITRGWVAVGKGRYKDDAEVEILSFEGIRVDGSEYREAGKETAGVDVFYKEGSGFGSFHLGGTYEPELIIKRPARTNEGRLSSTVVTSYEPVSRWGIPITYNVSGEGPFAVTQRGEVTPLSIGAARLMMNIGKTWYLYRKITANRWSYELDKQPMEGNVSPGVTYRLVLNVLGPVDMKNYPIRWGGKNVKWQAADKTFVHKGNGWVVENYFTLADNVKKGEVIKIEVDVSNEKKKMGFSIEKYLKITPNIFSIELELAAKGQMPTSSGIDLFYPNYLPDGNTFRSYFKYRDKDGKEIDTNEIKAMLSQIRMTLNSDTPTVVQVFPGGGQVGTGIGESMVSAQLDLGDKKLTSKWVKVTANKLMLTKADAQGGSSYILRVIGPADMGKYQAVFHHNRGFHRTSFIKGSDGSQSAGISTTDKIEKVEILKEGQVVAMMPVTENIVLPEPGIKMLPIKLPGKVIDTITPVDMGSLTSTSACRDMLRKQFPQYYGAAPDDVLNPICQGMREKEKADLKEQRAVEKAQQEILKALKKEGRRLIVFSDATDVAAVVSGNFDPKRMYCRWRIERGGSLKFERPQTDIVRVGIDGACYNKITGFQGDFNTDAMATVELVYSYPPMPAGQFIPGSEAQTAGLVERKAIEEWVRR